MAVNEELWCGGEREVFRKGLAGALIKKIFIVLGTDIKLGAIRTFHL